MKNFKKIKEKAKRTREMRRDPRFIDTMGFLVSKGFLWANYALPNVPNKRLSIDDAVWAGKNIEPRILEVLPSAVLRLEKHFDLNPLKHSELFQVVTQLRKGFEDGDSFCGIPYKKLKIWANLKLKDGRVKTTSEKKVTKTFRLTPNAVLALKHLAKSLDCTETEVLERKLLK